MYVGHTSELNYTNTKSKFNEINIKLIQDH